MILHKYSDSVYNTLSECALKVSIPFQLNDPFECLLCNQGKWTDETPLEFISKNKENFHLAIHWKYFISLQLALSEWIWC